MVSNRLRDADTARAELYDVMQQDRPFEQKARAALELGERYLAVQNGHVTRIDEETDFWKAIASTDPPDGAFPAGEVLDYRTTYCRRTVQKGSSLALHDAPEQGWADDPAFETHELNCYHGTPLTVDGELYGTVCFVSEEPRETPFSESETLFAELIGRMLEHELKLTRKEDELAMQTGLITVLSRILRHNLRNDLTVIRGQLNLIQENTSDGSDLYDSATEKIDQLTDLAETARELESITGSDPDRRPVELTRLVEDIVEQLAPTYPSASFSVASPGDVMVEALPTLRRAIEELLDNAAKHGDAPTVRVAIEETTDGVRIRVRDDGPGLPEQERTVLDDGTETPLVHGSGLGLWLIHWIVAEHDGTIEPAVTDEGTEVTIELPAAETPADVTETESLVELFHREQDRFEAVFEESHDAIVIADDEGRCIEANERATELFGCSREDLLGLRGDAFAPDDIDVEARWEAFLESGEQQGTVPLVRQDGTQRVVEYRAVADIIPGQHLSVLRDVTDRVESEDRYDAIFNNAYQSMGLLDLDGTVLETNEPSLAFAGLEEADVIGEKMWETYWFQSSEETRDKVRAAVEQAASGEFVRDTLEVQGAQENMVVDFSVRPVTDDEGAVTYLIPEGRDIGALDQTLGDG